MLLFLYLANFRTLPQQIGLGNLAAALKSSSIDALMVVGGFEVGSFISYSRHKLLSTDIPGIYLNVAYSSILTSSLQAYQTVVQMVEARKDHPAFCIPLVVVPSTISNNMPGTDFSLGSDTSLNEIVSVSLQTSFGTIAHALP